jgi:hypothetical protein
MIFVLKYLYIFLSLITSSQLGDLMYFIHTSRGTSSAAFHIVPCLSMPGIIQDC